MTFLQRILGIVLFRPAAYRYVATNADLTVESTLIVVLVAIVNTLVYTWLNGLDWRQVASSLVVPIVGWVFISWLYAWVARRFFKVKVATASLLRALGYARIFGILYALAAILGTTSSFGLVTTNVTTGVLLVAEVLCIRETGQTSTKKALAIVLLPIVLVIAVLMVFVIVNFVLKALIGQLAGD